MKLAGIFGLIALFSCFGLTPLVGHEAYHHGYTNANCWDCENHSQHHDMHCQSTLRQRESSSRVINLETFEGKIAEVVYLPGTTADNGMVELRIQSANRARLVRLAPAGYLKQAGFLLKEGDAVQVKGYLVAAAEEDMLVATEMKNGTKQLTLRDANGRQVW